MLDSAHNKNIILFFLAITLGILSIWISPHLPLPDFPQHVGQLTLLKSLLFDKSQWSEILSINYYTPNLIIYYLGLGLSTIFSTTTAFKILLSIAYLTFIYTCIQLRKSYKGNPKLDWLFLLPFFGFAYKWGFVTFVISTPIALLFLLVTENYAKSPSIKGALLLTTVGLVLLESHGLLFLFTFGVSGLLLLAHSKNIRTTILSLLPYFILFSIFIILYKFNSDFNAQQNLNEYSLTESKEFSWGFSYKRIAEPFLYSVTRYSSNPTVVIYIIAVIMMFITPWAIGLRPNFKNKLPFIMFSLVCICFLIVPKFFLGTFMIYQRFAIFFMPSYALLFCGQTASKTQLNSTKQFIQKISFSSLIFIILFAQGFHLYTNYQFKKETKEIDLMISNLEPNQRAFFIIVDSYSDADKNDYVYWDYPLWYQAEKKGFVERNFAALAPFPIRYKPNRKVNESDDTESMNLDADGKIKVNLQKYRYIFIRNDANEPRENVFDNYTCQPVINSSAGKWTIYDTKNCNS